MNNVIGFGDDELEDEQFKKTNKVKNPKKLGGFHVFGLNTRVIKGIHQKGYKMPTPIQRKTIPFAMEGRDVVAMARTGSGKTACFLIPLFEKLLKKSGNKGIRALILTPTRELAIQTLRFVKELGKFTGIRSAVVLGGDAMESQFSALHNNPDLIVATPGRFLHICVEMNLKLNSIEYVVFDEADRLFEMGFGEQLHEIIQRLPESRQTLLFSATLPKVLVEFAKAGLSDPVLVRLDVESKLPNTLKLSFLSCNSDEKPAALLCLIKHVISRNTQIFVFAATKHHVEYLHKLLQVSGIRSTYLYSDLDPSARKINAAKFQMRKVQVLIVTDVAARGIDIPHLDAVINYNFPAKPKLFVHRVGRCARAGREGHAYSLLASDECCYFLDLLLFLGRPLNLVENEGDEIKEDAVGCIPQSLIEEELSRILQLHETNSDVNSLMRVSNNAYKNYLRSRPGASYESVKRVKEINWNTIGVHPLFASLNDSEASKFSFLTEMKKYRPPGTIFEICQAPTSEVYNVMKMKRNKHHSKIIKHHEKIADRVEEKKALSKKPVVSLEGSNTEDISSTFRSVITERKRKLNESDDISTKKRKSSQRDENYIPYKPPDMHTELGLSVNSFSQEASKAVLDLIGDTENSMKKVGRAKMIWDKKKKKMVGTSGEGKVGKIKSESGAWIPATYRSGRYDQWVAKTKVDAEDDSEQSDIEGDSKSKPTLRPTPHTHWGRHNAKANAKVKSDLKRPEQILKARRLAEKKKKLSQKKKKRRRK